MKFICYCLLLINMSVCLVSCTEVEKDCSDIKIDRRQQLLQQQKEKVINSRTKINFWGKVVDQEGNPVEGATVIMHVRDFTKGFIGKKIDTECKSVTNSDGIFSLKGKKGHWLFIDNIEKEGYEYDVSENVENRGFNYKLPSTINDNYDKPVLYYLKNVSDVAYLVTSRNITCRFEKNISSIEPIYFPDWISIYGEYNNLHKEELDTNNDLVITCKIAEDKSKFSLAFESKSGNSSFYLSDYRLDEAPEDGYDNKCMYENSMIDLVKKNKLGLPSQLFYLYVKGLNGKYYSRIECKVSTRSFGEYFVFLDYKSYTNPYGKRNLLYFQHFNEKERRFRQDAQQCRVDLERRKRARLFESREKESDEEEYRKKAKWDTPWIDVDKVVAERRKAREAGRKEQDEEEEKEFKKWVESLRGGKADRSNNG